MKTFDPPGGDWDAKIMPRRIILGATLPILIVLCAILASCGPRPPIPFQQLQVHDSELSEGYDVYVYVAVKPGYSAERIEELLKWFDERKYPEANKLAVYVWDNPQAALIGAMGDLVGSIEVDRQAGVYEIDISGTRR